MAWSSLAARRAAWLLRAPIRKHAAFKGLSEAMKTSVMFESYCADIERLVREGTLRPAVRLAVALPDICAALEDSQMHSSADRYSDWCGTWLMWQAVSGGLPVAGARLYGLYAGGARLRHPPGPPSDEPTTAALARMRMSRRARRERALARERVWHPANRLQAFQVELIEALVDSGRRWYREQGANNALVQRNLGRLLVTG